MIRRLAWGIRVGPVEPQEPLKVEEGGSERGWTGGRGREPRHVSGHQKLEKAEEPWSLQKECSPANTLIVAQRLLTSQTVR